jgi:hypothetical protein
MSEEGERDQNQREVGNRRNSIYNLMRIIMILNSLSVLVISKLIYLILPNVSHVI